MNTAPPTYTLVQIQHIAKLLNEGRPNKQCSLLGADAYYLWDRIVYDFAKVFPTHQQHEFKMACYKTEGVSS